MPPQLHEPPRRPSHEQPLDATFRSLIHTLGLLKRVMEPHFAKFGLSGSQWGVLRALYSAEQESESGLRFTDLGERLLVRPPSVSGVVERLLRLGLLRTERVEGDHRAKRVSLTIAGRHRVRRVLDEMPAQVESVLGCLDGAERKQLQQLLEKLGTQLESMTDIQPMHAAADGAAA